MFVDAVSKILPPHSYDQEDLTRTMKNVWRSQVDERALNRLNKFHESVSVRKRSLALPKEEYELLDSFSKANRAFIDVGTQLAEKALKEALAAAETAADELDAVFFTTVTGLAVPTIDARLINALHLRRDIKRVPLFGLGCVAGVAGIARMHDYLAAYPHHKAALIAVELCSLTLQSSDFSIANAIASGLFGDGSAVVIGSGRAANRAPFRKKPRVLRTKSCFYYDSEDVMGWDIGTDGFKIILNAKVPQFVAECLPGDLDSFLSEAGLERRDITSWVCHPGGPKVLEAMEAALGVKRDALQLTWNSLEDVGNLSSASVLFVLADTMKLRPGRNGDYGVMIAMGPGFCSELVLFQW